MADATERGTSQAGLALYRKYRPATFAEVRGQEHVTAPLRQALKSGRINHAYLFSGPRGCGKTSSARILARSLNCVNGPTPDPCGVCDSCEALAPSGPGSIDVIEIDAASHGGVDDARDLRERAFYSPVSGRYKIYIIDEAHMVTSQGFNALLKLVEEPPPHLKFIFATTEPEKVIPTIRSRTHHYPFRLMPPSVMRELAEEILKSERVGFDPAVLPLVVRAGGGSARDTLSILDQLLAGSDESGIQYDRAVSLLGYTDATLIDEIVDAFAAADGGAVFRSVNRVIEGGHEPRRFASDLLDRFRDLIVIASVPDAIGSGLIEVPPDRVEVMTAQARTGLAQLTRAAEIVNAGLDQMRGATSPRLLLELMCAQVLLPGAASDERSVLARLERLESGAGRVPQAPMPRPSSMAGQPSTTAQAPSTPTAPQASYAPSPAAPAAPAPAFAAPAPMAPAPAAPASAPSGAVASPASRESAPTPPASAPEAPPWEAPQDPAAQSPAAQHPAAQQPAAQHPAERQPTAQQQPPVQQGYAGSSPQAPAAPSAPPAPRGAVTTQTIQQGWDGVLQALMARRKVAWILVRTATVVSLDEGVLTLRFPRAGDVKGFASSVHEGLLKEVLNERFGINVMIRPMAGGDPGPGERRQGGPQYPSSPAPPSAPSSSGPPFAPSQPGGQPSAAPGYEPQPPAAPAASPSTPPSATPQQHSAAPQFSAPPPAPTAMQSAAVQFPTAQAPASQQPTGTPSASPQATGTQPASQRPTGAQVTGAKSAGMQFPAAPNAGVTVAAAAPVPPALPPMPHNGNGSTSDHVSFGDDVPFPGDDDPYAYDGDELAGSVDMDAASQLTGIGLIQRDLGAQIIAEYEE